MPVCVSTRKCSLTWHTLYYFNIHVEHLQSMWVCVLLSELRHDSVINLHILTSPPHPSAVGTPHPNAVLPCEPHTTHRETGWRKYHTSVWALGDTICTGGELERRRDMALGDMRDGWLPPLGMRTLEPLHCSRWLHRVSPSLPSSPLLWQEMHRLFSLPVHHLSQI